MTVRKTVTVLFADVVGSTATGEQLDPEATRRLMARWFEEARSILESHGGTVEKFIGDAVMAVFGFPVAHEDDALRAVRSAAELRDRVEGVQLRIGVNTGEVVAGEGEPLVTGDAVNVAARLEQTAAPGEILIGEPTYRLVPAAVEVDALPPVRVKGKREPLAAYALRAVTPGAEAFSRRFDAPLVGRERELTALRNAYERAVDGSSCELVTIIGEPGIGKSRLARELTNTLASGTRVLSGRCLPYGDGITYWPLVEIQRELERSGEDVDERVKIATGAIDGAATSEEIFSGVRKLFERLAHDRPLVVVLDDLQWAEPTFLDLVEHIAYLARAARILLVGLARPELLEVRPGWPGTAVRLDALSDAEARQLARHLGANGRSNVLTAAAGNPLFIEQMLALGDARTIPPTVQALLAARLDRLAPTARRAIECASIIGEEFLTSAVRRLAGEDLDVGRALLELVRQGLVQLTESVNFPDEDAFRFAHILVRDAAYDGIAKESRARLHELFATWVEGRDVERGLRHDEIVGYHFEQAFRLKLDVGFRDEPLAAEGGVRLLRGGVRAFERGDARGASSLLSRTRELLPRSDPRRLHVGDKLAAALRSHGELARASEVLEETIADARTAGEDTVAERAVLQRLSFAIMDGDATGDQVRAAVEHAIPTFEEAGDDAGLALAWGVYAATRWMEHRIHDSFVARERALEHARRTADPELEASHTIALVITLFAGLTPVEEALGRLDDIATEASVRPSLEAELLKTRARLHAMRGDIVRARDLMERGIALDQDLGQSVGAAISQGTGRAFIAQLADDDEAAAGFLREGCDTLQAMGERAYLSSCAGRLASALYRLRRYDEAAEWISVSESVRPATDVDALALSYSVRARLLARRGELEHAERLTRELLALLEPTDFYQKAYFLIDAGEALALIGRRDEAETLFAKGKEIFEQKGSVAELRLADRQQRDVLGELAGDRLA